MEGGADVKDWMGKLRAALSPPVLFALLIAALLLTLVRTGDAGERTMTELEVRVSRTLSGIEGAGKVDVVIRTQSASVQAAFGEAAQSAEVPCGAIAVAQGADDPVVRMKLTQALCALLGLQSANVDVLAMTGGNGG